jgi:hypothetical protein
VSRSCDAGARLAVCKKIPGAHPGSGVAACV